MKTRSLKQNLFLFAVFLCSVGRCATFGVTPEQIPHPVLHYSGCGRDEPSYVCDASKYISESSLVEIDNVLDRLRTGFEGPLIPCPRDTSIKGYEIGVAIIPKMERSWYSDVQNVGAEFARKLFDYWGIGDSSCNNGLLLFISVEDRFGFVATGQGVRRRIPDWKGTKIIQDHMGYYLRKGQYGTAILAGLKEIEKDLNREVPLGDKDDSWIFYSFFTFFLLIIGLALYSDYQKDKQFKLMQRRVQRLENDRDLCRKNEYNIDSCPICLDDLVFTATGARNQADLVIPRNQTMWKRFTTEMNGYKNYIFKRYQDNKKNFRENLRMSYPRAADFLFGKVNHDVLIDLENGDENSYSKNAFAVKCGHIFCEKCIKTWLEKHDNCPICKKKVISQELNTNPSTPAPLQDRMQDANVRDINQLNQQGIMQLNNRGMRDNVLRNFGRDLLWQDLNFRVHRLHYYHPTYINTAMVNHFVAEPRSAYLTRHEHFVQKQKAHVERHQSNSNSGSRSSSRGFGGGASSGGGGGSW